MDKEKAREPRPPPERRSDQGGDRDLGRDRELTDASLNAERTVADDMVKIGYQRADDARDLLRKSTDQAVRVVREDGDERLTRKPLDARATVRRERRRQDQSLRAERALDDEMLHQEREQAQSNATAVSGQREVTDESLRQERTDADVVLGLNEESFRMLVEQSQDYAIFMLDCVGNVVSWNAGAERIVGYRPDEIIGKHFSVFFTHEDLALGRPQEYLQRATKEGRVEVEARRVRNGGSTFMAHVILTPFRDQRGKHRGFVKIIQDITVRLTSAERELTRVQESLRLVNQHVATVAALHANAEKMLDAHQRRAERFTAQLGRPRSLYLFLLVVVVWVAFNGIATFRGWPVLDPLPCFFLQGVVSVYAVLMTTVVLVTQTRQQKYAEQRAYLELQVNLASEQKTAKVISLLEELRRDLPIVRDRVDHQATAMAQAVDPQAILVALDETLKPAKKSP